MQLANTSQFVGLVGPLSALSDDALLLGLSRLLAQSRRLESDLVAHIAEVDARRLWAREAFPSMFAYCTGSLNLSESEAYLRIAVGRASREHPSILRLLAEGRLHLSGIAVLAPHLTSENAERLFARAAFKSKREIEELVTELAPRPDAPTSVRKLPSPRTDAPTLSGMGRTVTSASAPTASTNAAGLAFEGSGCEGVDRPAASIAGAGRAGAGREGVGGEGTSHPSLPRHWPPALQTLAPGRHKVQFTASSDFRRKLERLCALMRARVPDGDLGAVLEAVVSEKLERIEARRFGAKARQSTTESVECGPEAYAAPASRHIPAAVRRAVRDRDGGRCTYVDSSGRRCTERDRLEYHHRHPFALGGNHRPENVRLLCRAHNALAAESDFGSSAMARYRRRAGPPGSGPTLSAAPDRV